MSARPHGATVVELLVGATLGLLVVSALAAALGAGGRLLVVSARRAEAEDTAQLAVEALTFDLRRSGFDAGGGVVVPLTEAAPDRLTLEADLDGDGTVDPASEEITRYRCDAGGRRLSRLVGRQSMPLADRVGLCVFSYLDARGAPLVVPAAGLARPDIARVHAVELTLALRPAGASHPSGRAVHVALRSTP